MSASGAIPESAATNPLELRKGKHVRASACVLTKPPPSPVYIGLGEIDVGVSGHDSGVSPNMVATALRNQLEMPTINDLATAPAGSAYRLDLTISDIRLTNTKSKWPRALGEALGSTLPLALLALPVLIVTHFVLGVGKARLRLSARLTDQTGRTVLRVEDRQLHPSNRINSPLPWTKEAKALRALPPGGAELQILLRNAAASLTMELAHLLAPKR